MVLNPFIHFENICFERTEALIRRLLKVFLDKAVAVLSSNLHFGGRVGKGHLLPLSAEGNSKGTTQRVWECVPCIQEIPVNWCLTQA